MDNLVLSVFPGIDLLGRGFELEGFCVVRGPDLIWGGDVRDFHPPTGVFDGVIGGPPCQLFSRLRHMNPHCGEKHGNMIPEFARVVREAEPRWWVMENVPEAPAPGLPDMHELVLNNRWLGEEQNRLRHFDPELINFREEVGDVAIVLMVLCARYGIDMRAAIAERCDTIEARPLTEASV
jgi:DNA (cytosine-5)-methyltransferase 1